MGKHANSAAYREWERQQDRKQDEYFGEDEPLTEAERASQWDSESWQGKDDLASAIKRYALPVTRVDLWDEPRVMKCAI
ncbi:hypothetical protein [Paraburkholderia dilworthii]|uniref:hypothetical protein n=1 Tax=Paraburkholderia dilworthii TaxID=948106 RepID=UPI000486175D|nr:hypothetical protein [Paraburkholderia dilworthii]